MKIKIVIFIVFLFGFSSCSFDKANIYNTTNSNIKENNIESNNEMSKINSIEDNNRIIEKDVIPVDNVILEGLWHASAVMPASWSYRYFFKSNGTFIFLNSTMLNDNRDLGYSGHWEILNDKLIITKTERIIIEGGESVEYLPGMNIIEDGEEHVIMIDPPELVEYAITGITIDNVLSDDIDLKTLHIGEDQYWKYEGYSEEDIY